MLPKSNSEMLEIIERWTDTQSCGECDEMQYYAAEVLSIIEFMAKEINLTPKYDNSAVSIRSQADNMYCSDEDFLRMARGEIKS